MNRPFQRIGAESNAQVGRDFELVAQRVLAQQLGLHLQLSHIVPVGMGTTMKPHAFDLGCAAQRCLVECKSHRWTTGHNIPSAKLTVWNEAMFYFLASPSDYRKILFVLRDLRRGIGESLATYYLRTSGHMVPSGVEIWEYDEATDVALRVGI